MIKAEEIRLGNVYNRKHGKGWTETVIDENIMGKIFSDSKEYALDDFEPVPLTADILRQFGFVWNGLIHRWVHVITFYILIQTDFGFENGIGEARVKRPKLKYIHQLQNIHDSHTGYILTKE
jgi:hypothetical protein